MSSRASSESTSRAGLPLSGNAASCVSTWSKSRSTQSRAAAGLSSSDVGRDLDHAVDGARRPDDSHPRRACRVPAPWPRRAGCPRRRQAAHRAAAMSSMVSSRSRIAEYSEMSTTTTDATAMLRENKRALGIVHMLDERRDLSAELRKRPDVLVELEWAHDVAPCTLGCTTGSIPLPGAVTRSR